MRYSRRGCIQLALFALIVIALAAFLVYRYFRTRVDLRPIVGPGEGIELNLPPGFESEIFAQGLVAPRFIAFGPDNNLYVAERGRGRIVSLPDDDGDGRADGLNLFADGLGGVHSLVYHNDAWFTGVPTGVVRLEDSDGDGQAERRQSIVDDIPGGGQHKTRTVTFLDDGRMVLSVGSSCNVCNEADPRRAAVLVYDGPTGRGEKVFATGLRNAVGLTLHPETGQLWATNNGRDLMGDDLPPDTIDVIEEGAHYGWPECHAGDLIDPDLGYPQACESVTSPAVKLQAHSAPLGLIFYSGDGFPTDYEGDLFVAYHGSWNRSQPTGYKVVRIPIEEGQIAGPVEDFATGWLDEEAFSAAGRPVGLAVGPDGALYISDDKAGIIYRIFYQRDT